MVAPAIAPPLGGLIVEHASWRWIFLLNLPLGIAGVALALRLLPRRPLPFETGGAGEIPSVVRTPDLVGFAFWAVAIVLLLGAVDGAARLGPVLLLAMAVLGGAALAAALHRFRRHPSPLLDVRSLRVPSFAFAVRSGTLFAPRFSLSRSCCRCSFRSRWGWALRNRAH